MADTTLQRLQRARRNSVYAVTRDNPRSTKLELEALARARNPELFPESTDERDTPRYALLTLVRKGHLVKERDPANHWVVRYVVDESLQDIHLKCIIGTDNSKVKRT